MVCHLTRGGMICFLFLGVARGEPANRGSDRDSIAGSATTLSVHWEGVALGDAIVKLEGNAKAAIFVDRRVDPTQRVELSIENATSSEILEKLASTRALGVSQIDTLLYLGPARAAAELNSLASHRREEISRLNRQEQQSLAKRAVVTWPRLTEPRDLIERFLQDHGWRIVGSERIPYDLWPAGQLPKMSIADTLTVFLIGFDLTYRPLPGKQTIEIVPIAEVAVAGGHASAPSAPVVRSPQTAKQKSTQRYTLRVQEQPVGKVLDQLSQQLHLEVKVDAAAIAAAGLSMDEHISFEVKDADFGELLDAVLRPAGLTFERDGEQLKILPR